MRRGVPCAVVATAMSALVVDSFHYASGGPASSCLAPPSFALPIFLPAFPPEALERSGDAALLGGADAWRLNEQGFACDLSHGDAGASV
jgi:hypothetical protein